MQEIGFFQLFEVGIDRLIVQRAMLRFQVIGDGFCRKSVADIGERIFHHTLQLIHFADLAAPDDIRKDGRLIDIPHDGVHFVLRIGPQMSCRKSAQTDIIGQLCVDILNFRILALEGQIFLKRQRIDAKRNIAPREIGGNFRGHHAGVGARYIEVHITIRRKGIDNALPAVDLLHLIQKEIGPLLRAKPGFEGRKHLLCGHILVLHGVEAHTDDLFRGDVSFCQQFFHDHFQDSGLAAAPHTRQYFNERSVRISHDLVQIQRSFDHCDHLHSFIILQFRLKINLVFKYNRKIYKF